uniref:SUEL-type lectin domain-containing protein n=1 Tax=Chelydra serpentina TaxID=8475 RepID=A0A8C3SYC5_CHESE
APVPGRTGRWQGSELDAGQHPSRRQVEPGLILNLLYCVFLVGTKEIEALTDFSGYLTKLLQNHSVYACDGDRLSLQCPRHSTISVQSAFYGQDYQMCSTQQPETAMKDPLNCVASTTFSSLWSNGPPCNITLLLVSILAEHKTKSACENEELKLHCKESKFLNIYSATYGRSAHEKDICSTEVGQAPQFDCLSYTALEVLSKRCYGKQRCKIIVNNNHFGSPCLPGVKKYLNVSYACVPKIILTAVDPMISNLNPSLKQNDGEYDINIDPRESRLPKKDGIIISNSLATFAYIRDHPERAALLFVSSVCVGLVFTLCALVIHVSCTNDFPKLHRMKDHSVLESDKADDHSDDEDDEDSSDSDLPNELTGFYRISYSGYNSTEAAELAERIERREQIMQEIWMNSGLDMSPTRNISPFYINEQQSGFFG